jgi:threonine/homoserine/homoserine lactone efflux protein
VVGAIYLIYLGARLIFAKQEAAPSAAVQMPRRALTTRALFRQGFFTNLLNPKVVLFFVSFFPQFVAPGSAHKTLAFLTLGAIFVLMSMIWNSFVAWIAGSVSRGIAGRPFIKTLVDRVVGTAFVGLGVKLALTRH